MNQPLRFALKVLAWLLTVNVTISLLLWALQTLSYLSVTLTYEALFLLILGAFQILSSRIYREDSVPSRYAERTAWWNFKKFAKLTPEERQRFRQEGVVMVTISIILLATIAIVHIYLAS